MPAAARILDTHSCPMLTGTVPHEGGQILSAGVPTVLIGGLPAAVIGDSLTCNGSVNTIATGSATVLIGGRPAARLGDSTAHGGVITSGEISVQIGG